MAAQVLIAAEVLKEFSLAMNEVLSQEQLSRIVNPPPRFSPLFDNVVLRDQVEDFLVEEVPRYVPDGTGEHLFLWIEKRDLPAGELLSCLSSGLGVSQRDIGVAGQKDRRAVTRQFVSVPSRCGEKLESFSHPKISILSAGLHHNKLRMGHLIGNRFVIRLRSRRPDSVTSGEHQTAATPAAASIAESDEVFSPEQVNAVRDRLAEIRQQGFPNYYGPQRFGYRGRTLQDGLRKLTSEESGERSKKRDFLNLMSASAVQSAVFNLVVAQRVMDGTACTPESGDVVCGRTGIRPFAFDERGNTAAEGLIPMGPMPGPEMFPSTGRIREVEMAAMAELGLNDQLIARHRKQMPGTRRRMVEFPEDAVADLHSDGSIELRFQLPAGCYANVLLAEVCRFLTPLPVA